MARPRDESGLVAAVRRELTNADRLNTVDGQLALLLATEVDQVASSGLAGLSVEIRRVMACALVGTEPEVEDDVTRARKARDEKRRLAGLDVDR